jgi:ankyrin repeat protein
MATSVLDRIADGRTDLVFEYLSGGRPTTSKGGQGMGLMHWCAYYGDVSAMRFLLGHGESLRSLGEDLGLHAAAFHGHWRLVEYLVENGADVDVVAPDTGETPLHSALCTDKRTAHDLVLKVLLTHGADPNRSTRHGCETGSFMRDCRTKGETPLHRAAAFGTEDTVNLLLDAGAALAARDMNGDTPLSWASWHLRPDTILRRLCYGDFSIHPERRSMEGNLLGVPHGRP